MNVEPQRRKNTEVILSKIHKMFIIRVFLSYLKLGDLEKHRA